VLFIRSDPEERRRTADVIGRDGCTLLNLFLHGRHSTFLFLPLFLARTAHYGNDTHGHVCLTETRCHATHLIARRNSTTFFPSPETTYWATFDEISTYNVQLNILERLWAAWYAFMQNDVLATGIMSFMMHEIVYFGRSLPWMIIDRIPAWNKYKIQNVRLLHYKHRVKHSC